MDWARLIAGSERIAPILHRAGLGRLTTLGASVIDAAIGDALSAEVDGLRVTGSVQHRHYLHALARHSAEPFTQELFKQAVRPEMVVVDIGAFVGCYTLLAARSVGRSGRVYAFEPDERNFERLARNVRINGLSDVVVASRCAVADKQMRAPFYLNPGDQSQSSLYFSLPDGRRTTVDSVTLDEFSHELKRIDVIKMDIEGGELRALNGMRRLLGSSRVDSVMFVECNATALRSAGTDAESLLQAIEALGFTVSAIDEEARRLRPRSFALEEHRYVNLYCRRS